MLNIFFNRRFLPWKEMLSISSSFSLQSLGFWAFSVGHHIVLRNHISLEKYYSIITKIKEFILIFPPWNIRKCYSSGSWYRRARKGSLEGRRGKKKFPVITEAQDTFLFSIYRKNIGYQTTSHSVDRVRKTPCDWWRRQMSKPYPVSHSLTKIIEMG